MKPHRYDFEIDLSNPNSGHTIMVDLIGGNKRVLETGCATGYMSRVLVDRGCRVTGLDIDAGALERAAEVCERTVLANLDESDLSEIFEPQSFDVVVFGDVLEHLPDPIAVLRKVRPLLVPDGFVVASIPNIAHGAVRLALLSGRFDYTKLGLLDETHLRFFTREAIADMFEEAGFVVVETRRTVVGLFDTEIPIDAAAFPPGVVEEVSRADEATTYQFVVKAVLDNGLEAVRQLHEREQRQHRQIEVLEQRAAELASEVEELRRREESYKAEVGRLEAELADHVRRLDEAWARIHSAEGALDRLNRRLVFRVYRRLKAAVSGGSARRE